MADIKFRTRQKKFNSSSLIIIPEQKPLIGYFHINFSTKPVLNKGSRIIPASRKKKFLTGSFIRLISKIHKYNRCCIHFGFKVHLPAAIEKKIFNER